MRSVCTAYTGYFNRKYKRVGHLFQSRFKASHITNDGYLQHISRYIHLNPKNYLSWPNSSLDYYLGRKTAEWIRPAHIMQNFEGSSYIEFLKDFEDQKAMLDELKNSLANY